MGAQLINVRGANGSGKTTLLRCLARDPRCRVVPVHKPEKGKPIPVTLTPDGLALLGDYTPTWAAATTAGCDRISRQDDIKAALLTARDLPGVRAVLFEGIIVSTIYGPWRDFGRANGGMVWVFLDTPLEVCLKRVQERNGGKPVKESLIADKVRTIARVRAKAKADGERVYDVHWETALRDFKGILAAVAGPAPGEEPEEADGPWAEGWVERAGKHA